MGHLPRAPAECRVRARAQLEGAGAAGGVGGCDRREGLVRLGEANLQYLANPARAVATRAMRHWELVGAIAGRSLGGSRSSTRRSLSPAAPAAAAWTQHVAQCVLAGAGGRQGESPESESEAGGSPVRFGRDVGGVCSVPPELAPAVALGA